MPKDETPNEFLAWLEQEAGFLMGLEEEIVEKDEDWDHAMLISLRAAFELGRAGEVEWEEVEAEYLDQAAEGRARRRAEIEISDEE